MTQPTPQLSDEQAQALLRSLLHKEGNWIDWGKNCQALQKAGYTTQDLFEATGFQGSQQNQVIVAAQVYESVVKAGASENLLAYCQTPCSDVLYEFRILTQDQRLAAVKLAQEKRLDVDAAHEVARALKAFGAQAHPPTNFSDYPGDAVAYLYWKQAREKQDLQARSRLIAQGLKFATSDPARTEIEQLLLDFTVVPTRTAPLLPVYRLEAEEELPRIVPLAGKMPLTASDITAVPPLTPQEPFRSIQLPPSLTVVPLPGWQAVLQAKHPVAFLILSQDLPNTQTEGEEVLVLIDRASQTWDDNSYFLTDQNNQLKVIWTPDPPPGKILGKVVLILRPKKIVDEGNIIQPWQMDD